MAEITRAKFIDMLYSSSNRGFSGLDLSGLSLENLDLSNLNFNNCNLSEVDLSGANLSNSQFEGCDLTGVLIASIICSSANFKYANFGGANFTPGHRRCDFTNCNFYGASFGVASILHCNFTNSLFDFSKSTNDFVLFNFCVFSGCSMKNLKMDGKVCPHKTKIGISDYHEDDGSPIIINYQDPPSKQTHVQFLSCFFDKTYFEDACISHGKFFNCTFDNLEIKKSDFSNAYFSDSKFNQVTFIQTDLQNTGILSENLSNVSFIECDLRFSGNSYYSKSEFNIKNSSIRNSKLEPHFEDREISKYFIISKE